MLKSISLLFLGVLVWTSESFTIKSPEVTKYGDWGEMQYCPKHMYAVGMRLKIEQHQGIGDDTGLNAVALICQPLNSSK